MDPQLSTSLNLSNGTSESGYHSLQDEAASIEETQLPKVTVAHVGNVHCPERWWEAELKYNSSRPGHRISDAGPPIRLPRRRSLRRSAAEMQ